MHQPTDTHHTTKDLSPKALAQYPLQNRKGDRMLLQRAWHTVHRIASMLYEDFDATQVAVFGSLAEPDAFSRWSDIDIAVWGIPSKEYFRAVWKAEEISGLFKIDLVDFESSKRITNPNSRTTSGASTCDFPRDL